MADHAGRLIGRQCATACGPALGAVPVGLRFRRGRAPGFALLIAGGGLPPRRCACTVSCALVCANALAVAAAATSTVWRIQGSSHLAAAAAAIAAVRRAAAAGFSAERGCVAARWGSVLGQRLPRLLHWWDCPCHWHRVWYVFASRGEPRMGQCSSQPARRWLKNCCR